MLRYMAGARALGLHCGAPAGFVGALPGFSGAPADSCVPPGLADSGYAVWMLDRKSVSCCVFLLDGAAVSWLFRKQVVIALCCCEAEIAAAMAVREALWLRTLMSDLGVPFGQDPMVLWRITKD